MIGEERVQAVQALGFLPRQARFLMTVALSTAATVCAGTT